MGGHRRERIDPCNSVRENLHPKLSSLAFHLLHTRD
jgi:hypothetical protein